MSAPSIVPQRAFPPTSSQAPITPARKRRRGRLAVLLLVLFSLPIVMSGIILLFCPPVLEAMSAMVIKPTPGAIPWNGHDRITVVAMGLTQRTPTDLARTDTLLAMDIDPSHHRINMLSVPRDLWVNIPGYGQGKLAIAYEMGGPKLAAYTLEHELGIPVDYTLALTFWGFTNIVNAMGGVTVDVPQELKDPTYPCLVGFAYCPIDIKPGTQHMDGATALEFVRERHAFADQDLARVKDQQAFSDAAKRTLLSPVTWTRYPAILRALQDGVKSNLPLNDAPAIAAQYLLSPKGGVHHQYINIQNGLVKAGWSQDGQSILTPTDTTSIPTLVHRLFGDPTLTQENASIAVLNGTVSSGAATDAQSTLQNLGFHTILAGNADRTNYRQSEVIVNTAVTGPAEYTARRLQRIMNARIVREALSGQSARIVVVIGSEFPGVSSS